MLLTLGLDSLFGALESVTTALQDVRGFGKLRREVLSGEHHVPYAISERFKFKKVVLLYRLSGLAGLRKKVTAWFSGILIVRQRARCHFGNIYIKRQLFSSVGCATTFQPRPQPSHAKTPMSCDGTVALDIILLHEQRRSAYNQLN